MKLSKVTTDLLLAELAPLIQAGQPIVLDDLSPTLKDSIQADIGSTPIDWSAIIALIMQLLPLIMTLFGKTPAPAPADERAVRSRVE